jgi:hypothetical protein
LVLAAAVWEVESSTPSARPPLDTGASVARETTDAAIAYAKIRASLPRSTFVKFRQKWLPKTSHD